MTDLPALSYTSLREALAEKFHLSEALLSALNPGHKFDASGVAIVVPDIAMPAPKAKAERLEVDKTRQTVKAFDKSNNLIAFYPANRRQRRKALAVRGVQDHVGYRQSDLSVQSGLSLQGCHREDCLHCQARAEQPSRHALDRAECGGVRHSRHTKSGQRQQGRFPWLRTADQLGRRAAGDAGQEGNPGRIRRRQEPGVVAELLQPNNFLADFLCASDCNQQMINYSSSTFAGNALAPGLPATENPSRLRPIAQRASPCHEPGHEPGHDELRSHSADAVDQRPASPLQPDKPAYKRWYDLQ